LAAACGWCLASGAHAVDLANIVVTLNGGNPLNPPTVTIPVGQSTVANAGLGTEGFFIDAGTVLGEYPIRIGASAANDAAGGVLLGYVRENGRNVSDPGGPLYATSGTVRDGDPTSTNTRGGTGGLSLAVHRAGEAIGGGTFGTHAPFAANLAAAYFPYSQGWLAGTASSSVNNGAIDQFTGSPGLTLGANFIVDGVGPNKHRLVLPGVTDSRRQGLLFVNHAKNEANYALSEPDDNGNGFVVVTHDNATDGPATTVDPLSFVFIPLNTPNVTMARIHPSSGQDLQPAPMLQSGLPFTIVREGDVVDPAYDTGIGGRYRLSIPGHSPTSGTLLVSPSTLGRNSGGSAGGNQDNIVTYQADGNDWIILAQDLPNLGGTGAFARERNSYFNFAYIPFNAPPAAPAPIVAPAWNRSRVVGWNADLIREAAGQETGGTYVAEVTQKTSDITVQGLSENYGDYCFAVSGDFLTLQDGVLFTSVREGLRDNSASGGFFEYGITTAGIFTPEWAVFVDSTSPNQGEHEVNIAATFFGADSGFTLGSQIDPPGPTMTVSLPGVNSRTDGVLIVQEGSNGDNYALSTPNADGTAWDIEIRDDGTTASNLAADRVNYVYLPYESQNLVAGWVDEDGTLLSSTDTSGFSLTKDTGTPGTYLLTIPGKSSATGTLLLTATGANGSVDNVLAYEAAGDSFRILGIDMITTAEANGGTLNNLEDTEFSFAYIDFDAPPIAPGSGPAGDFDGDNDVDGADFLAWQRNYDTLSYDAWKTGFGTAATAAGNAVPEPATYVGAVAGILLLVRRRERTRRHRG